MGLRKFFTTLLLTFLCNYRVKLTEIFYGIDKDIWQIG